MRRHHICVAAGGQAWVESAGGRREEQTQLGAVEDASTYAPWPTVRSAAAAGRIWDRVV